MKKIGIISCGVALIFVAFTVLAMDKKPTTQTEASAKVEELAKQVDSLQAKIKELEQRLAKMEKTKNKAIVSVTPPASGMILPRAFQQPGFSGNEFADPSRPPKIWGEGTFNGWKYYTIPLSATEPGTAQAIPLTGGMADGR